MDVVDVMDVVDEKFQKRQKNPGREPNPTGIQFSRLAPAQRTTLNKDYL